MACICAATPLEKHLPGCPEAYCTCGRPAPARPHRSYCPATRAKVEGLDLHVVLAVPFVAERLVKADALLAKQAEARLKMRELRVALVLHGAKETRPAEPEVRS